MAFVQLYLESIQDLLEIESKDIRIREDPEKGVFLEGIQWFKCNSPEECSQIFHKGELNRNTQCTKMNAHSSRSHAILIMKIEKSVKITNPKNIKNIKNNDRLLTCSYLHLVDLAGSERVRKTGATDMRLEEAKKINLSLLCLGNVIASLTNPNASHISYRDSKLTRILKESLGGNAKTSLIVTVSPSSYNTEETMSSLYFALRAMKVQNKPIINKTVDYQALCVKLQDDLDKLNDDYAKLKIEYDKVYSELEKYKKGEKYFELQKNLGISNDLSLQLNQTENSNRISEDVNLNNTNSTNSNTITLQNSKQNNKEKSNVIKNINTINNIGNRTNINYIGSKNNNNNNTAKINKNNIKIITNVDPKTGMNNELLNNNEIENINGNNNNINKNVNNTNINTNNNNNNSINNNSNNNINNNANSNNNNNNNNNNKNNINNNNQIKKIKQFYEKLMKNKTEEYELMIKKVDDMVYKKESEIEQLKSQINSLNDKIMKQKEDLDDMSKEKEDLQNSVSTLSAQVEEQKNLLKNDKSEKEYKALIEMLNDNIASLEKKIIKLEDTSTFSETSKEKIVNSLDYKVNEFQSQINNLTQKKNNSIIKKAQNEIKINLISREKNIDYKTNEKINEEITQIQKENFDLLVDQESITKKVEVIESQINSTKKINKNLKNLLEKYNKKNKAELIMSLAKKEIDTIILNESIRTYDSILMNVIELQYDDKFNLYKVENDMNNLINKSSLLLNNYLNYINKLDDINKELEVIINEPDNFDKLNQMRENIENLLEESEEINNITKSYNLYTNTNLNNISYDKCPICLENIISNMNENFSILIDTYNVTNSNICQMISLMEESNCYKKKFISNLSSFVQENVKDAFIKQNILYKLNELLKAKVDEKEYNNKFEEIIRELFKKITLNLNEKDKENKLLTQRINQYSKQIDENIKKVNINTKSNTNRNNMTINATDNEVNKLKLKILNQQRTISNTRSNIEKVNSSIDKVNDLIKSTNFNTNQVDSSKITDTLNECKNIVQKLSKGLNTEGNKIITSNLKKGNNKISIKKLQKENCGNTKNIKDDKKVSQNLFKQYFINLSKFSKTMIDYTLNGDEEDDKNN